jgi:hypothetical protein
MPYGLSEIYYVDGTDDASSKLIFLQYGDMSPTPMPGGLDMPGAGGVWFACNYKLSNFIKALRFVIRCTQDSDCQNPTIPNAHQYAYCDKYSPMGMVCKSIIQDDYHRLEFGLNPGTFQMLRKCKAMAMATPTETKVPDAGPAGWIKYGAGR